MPVGKTLRLDIVLLAVPVMMPHSALVIFVSIFIVLRLFSNALAFEFEEFRLDRPCNCVGNFVLELK